MNRIKYTDSYENIRINLDKLNISISFERNVFKEVSQEVADILLKNPIFLSEHDLIFNPELLKYANLKLGIKRFGACGDIIQLIPIIKYLKKTTNNKYYLLTNPKYVNDFKSYGLFEDVFESNYSRNFFDKMIYLDGVLEQDHSNSNVERTIHRVKLYEKFFNIQLDEYDFSVNGIDTNKYNEAINAILQRY